VAERVAVLLMDYGAPSSDDEVRPFIGALLSDPGMLPLPWGPRQLLAWWIAWKRAGKVRDRYRAVGGSPLPQAVGALACALGDRLGDSFAVRPAYCFAAPRIDAVVAELADEGVRRVLGVPLFPQRSTVTSDSCQRLLLAATRRHGLEAGLTRDFPTSDGLVDALADGLLPLVGQRTHVLMVAHGLPRRLAQAGDPYPERVRETAEALASRLPLGQPWSLAFQSRMGRAEWTGPYLEEQLERLAGEGVRELVLAPLSFAVENLETRWDLDHQATRLAEQLGMRRVARAPTPGAHPAFHDLLHALVHHGVRRSGWSIERGEA
jgi:protoporphyrin/coproporphyrin ferrochelatase